MLHPPNNYSNKINYLISGTFFCINRKYKHQRIQRISWILHINNICISHVELDLLDQGATCLSISRSEYLRKLLLEKQINHQIEVIADMNDLRKLVREYGKIGSNLNQIAKHFNSGGSQSRAIENQIHQCITDLFLLRKEVLKLAGGMNGNRKTH